MSSQDELIELSKPIGYSIRGAVAASGFSRSRIFEFIRDGKLEAVKDGGKTIVLAQSLRNCIASLAPARPSEAA